MNRLARQIVLAYLLLSLLPAVLLLLIQALNGQPIALSRAAAAWLGSLLILGISRAGLPVRIGEHRLALPWPALAAASLGLLALAAYLLFPVTWLAWVWAAAAALLLIWMEAAFRASLRRPLPFLARPVFGLVCAGLLGGAITGFWMVQSSFGEEEFFVAVQAAILAFIWLAFWFLTHRLPCIPGLQALPMLQVTLARPAVLPAVFVLVSATGLAWVMRHYQASSYPAVVEAPYDGIRAASPFLCGTVQPAAEGYDGEDVWRRLVARVEANPEKGAPEYGMLALATGDAAWAEQFRGALLAEARRGEYTGPAHSVKIGQYLAALRAYYYPLVRETFPNLFSPEEQGEIKAWFGAVNRRALTVEWVDWMYGLAFTMLPEGPYENQENGAGLLALLELHNLGDPELSARNRDYLQRNPRGWQERFRNNDDAITYQPIWINNALFQSLYTGQSGSQNERLAFAWLLAQSLPNGGELQYNHPQPTSLVGTAYLGAVRLNDPRLLWLAGRGVEELEARSGYLEAQPGIEQPVKLEGVSPDTGSCLLYADSGLPNQVGPLAPDKVVMRGGWQVDDPMLLLNLRFTGWHRYKGTNTLTLFYRGQPLAADRLAGERIAWLPYGRSHVRDKRIARENLNGLSVPRTGISRVIHDLTGMGGRWEQDPPFYADVIEFRAGQGDEMSYAWTSITDWHGWQHDRQIYASPGGAVVVIDTVDGPVGGSGTLFWHVNGQISAPDQVSLPGEPGGEMMLISENGQPPLMIEQQAGPNSPALTIELPVAQQGRWISLFLTGDWSGASVELQGEGAAALLNIKKGEMQMQVPLQTQTAGGQQ